MKIYLKAMAEDRAAIKLKLSNASEQLNMHLLKIFMYPDAAAVNHWKGEVYSFLHKVDKLKRKNKWPASEFIKDCISTHNDMVAEYVMLVEDEESELIPRKIPILTLEEMIERYDDWIASELSAFGIVRKSDVYNKIDELLGLI